MLICLSISQLLEICRSYFKAVPFSFMSDQFSDSVCRCFIHLFSYFSIEYVICVCIRVYVWHDVFFLFIKNHRNENLIYSYRFSLDGKNISGVWFDFINLKNCS